MKTTIKKKHIFERLVDGLVQKRKLKGNDVELMILITLFGENGERPHLTSPEVGKILNFADSNQVAMWMGLLRTRRMVRVESMHKADNSKMINRWAITQKGEMEIRRLIGDDINPRGRLYTFLINRRRLKQGEAQMLVLLLSVPTDGEDKTVSESYLNERMGMKNAPNIVLKMRRAGYVETFKGDDNRRRVRATNKGMKVLCEVLGLIKQ